MPIASYVQSSFLSGEWSPFFQGRADRPQYRTAMNVCRNSFPMEEGAWVRRPGSRLKSPTYQNQDGRIYPVEFRTDEPYEVEFTNGALRFYQGHSLVFTTDGAQTVSAVSTDTPAIASIAEAVTWASDDEIMFFFDSSHSSGALPLRQRVFRLTKTDTTHFTLKDALTGEDIDGSTLDINSESVVTAKRILRVASPYTSGAWSTCRIVQNQDFGVVLHKSFAPYILTINPGAAAGTATAALTKASMLDGPYLDPVPNSVATVSGTSGSITVEIAFAAWDSTRVYNKGEYVKYSGTSYKSLQSGNLNQTPSTATAYWVAVDAGVAVTGDFLPAGATYAGFQSTDVGRHIRLYFQPPDWDAGTTYSNGDLATRENQAYQYTDSNSASGIDPLIGATSDSSSTGLVWVPVAGKEVWTWGTITALTNSVSVTVQIAGDDIPIFPPAGTPSPSTIWRLGVYSDTTTYPACGTFYEGRFWLGGAVPNRFDTTKSQDFDKNGVLNFQPTLSDGVVADDNAISYTLQSADANDIFWFQTDQNDIICGTLGGEWMLQASSTGEPITPTSIRAKRVTKYGCANIEPRRTGIAVVFVQKYRRRVMELLSDVFSQRYSAPHLNEAAKHLTATGVAELAYQEELAPILWCRTGGGPTLSTDTLQAGATTSFRIWLYDDSCHQWTSNNEGASWLHRVTLIDTWTDQSIAYIDGDFSSTVALNDRGELAISLDGGKNWTKYTYANVTGGLFNSAISANAAKILLTGSNDYLYLSTDKGATVSSVATNLGTRYWGACCFNAGATIAYATSKDNYVSKSIDGGLIWSDLTGGPQEMHTSTELEVVERIRCSADGNTVIYNCGYTGNVYVSKNGGTSWTNVYAAGANGLPGDCGISYDGSTMIFIAYGPIIKISTDFGDTWDEYNPNDYKSAGLVPRTCNVSQDGTSFVVSYYVKDAFRYAEFSFDRGITWTRSSVPGDTFEFVNSFIYDVAFSPPGVVTRVGSNGAGPLIGATYRRVSAFTSETPAFVGWHRHDLGHARLLGSIGVSGDVGGLLDSLDMVTTDGTNTYVEGFTQIFDEDDDITDAWLLDGALVPDSAYHTSIGDGSITGLRFTGLWYLRTKVVTVCAFGLDLGDFTVDENGTVFVPYSDGEAPDAIDYTAAGAGAYLFTIDYINANLQASQPRNGGVFIGQGSGNGVFTGGGYMPVVVGFNFVSDGQILRPIAPEQVGTRTGPAFGLKRRSHYVKALLRKTLGIQFGTDFSATLQQASLKSDAAAAPTPTDLFSGMWRETLNDDYSFDSMISWRIQRPYPASVISIGASIEGEDV